MTDTVDVDFFAQATRHCPYPAYRQLREEAPVWIDPTTGTFQITRYEDCRRIALDHERFPNGAGNAKAAEMVPEEEAEPSPEQLAQRALDDEIRGMYERDGWLPGPNMNGRDGLEHQQLRNFFGKVLRPDQVARMDPVIEPLVDRLIDGFIEDGRCDWQAQFASRLPGLVFANFLGVPEEEMPQVKEWASAWQQSWGLMQTPDERRFSARSEIEAQHYFKGKFEQVRAHPDDSVLSYLVNTEVPGWGRKLHEDELQAHFMVDLFTGGAETTTVALANGMRVLIESPGTLAQLRAEPETAVDRFVEEALRLECPVQGLMRMVAEDFELHGVTIPAGSTVVLRYAAANRDEDHYNEPEQVDLDRPNPRGHLAFAVGKHFCIGAPLARRELHYTWRAVARRLEDLRFADGNDFAVKPHYFVRELSSLKIEFKPGGRVA